MSADRPLAPDAPGAHRRIGQCHDKGKRQQIIVGRQLFGQAGQVTADQPGVKIGIAASICHHRVPQQISQERDICLCADEMCGIQPVCKRCKRRAAISGMADHLGNHRIIKRGDGITVRDTAVNAHARPGHKPVHRAGGRHEIPNRVFGIKARLNRMTCDADIVL